MGNKDNAPALTGGRQRESWLDGLKGFAILLVILGHVLSGYLDAGMFGSAFWSIYITRSWIYYFHMPLFFLLSGYTFTLAYWPEGQLRRGRFLRQLFSIAWMYIVFGVLQWCVKAAVPGLVNDAYTLDDLKNMFVVPLGNFWYLYVLFVFYVVSALLQMPRMHPSWVLLFGGLSIVVLGYNMNWYHLTLYRILYHYAFFMTGSLLCQHRRLLASAKLMGCSMMFLSNAVLFYLCYYPRYWYSNWAVGLALSLSFVCLWLFYRYPRLASFPLFRICGRYSLELYLLHTFLTAGLRSMLTWAGITIPWLHVFINFALSTGLCLLAAWLASRMRWTDALFRPGRVLDRISARISARRERKSD